MAAAEEGHELIVQHLVHFGAHISYCNFHGENARWDSGTAEVLRPGLLTRIVHFLFI